MLTDIFKEVLLSGLVDGKGEEDKREPASLMKQESKDGVLYNPLDRHHHYHHHCNHHQVQYNPLDAGALVEGGKVIGQNSFKMAGQVCFRDQAKLSEIQKNQASKWQDRVVL